MEQGNVETQELSWTEAHPWLSIMAAQEEENSLDEVVCYTLDELRLS